MRQAILLKSAILAAIFSNGISGQAQTVPGGAEAGRVDERFEQTTPPTVQPRIIQGLESTVSPSQAAEITLKLNEVIVTGSSVYSPELLAGTYDDLVGNTVTLAQVFEIAAAITAKYGQDGYTLSRAIVPPQELNQGGATIQIQILEGYIDEVRWPAETAASRKLLSQYEASITSDRPLNVRTLERYLLLANDIPGSNFQSNLVASESTIGASTLVVTVGENRTSGFVSVDNHGVEASGPYQLTLGGTLNNNFGHSERLEAKVTFAGPSEGGGSELQ